MMVRRAGWVVLLSVCAAGSALAQGAAPASPVDVPLQCYLHPVMQTHTQPPLPSGFDPASTSGKTLLNLTVDVNGVVADASMSSSSGNDTLDKAAIDHVKTWLWRPRPDPACKPSHPTVLIDWSPPKPPSPPGPIHTVPRQGY